MSTRLPSIGEGKPISTSFFKKFVGTVSKKASVDLTPGRIYAAGRWGCDVR
jgi:hypothetical protein